MRTHIARPVPQLLVPARVRKHVLDRLRGYTDVKEYLREHQRRGREMFVPLCDAPGHAQPDFGEARVVPMCGHLCEKSVAGGEYRREAARRDSQDRPEHIRGEARREANRQSPRHSKQPGNCAIVCRAPWLHNESKHIER